MAIEKLRVFVPPSFPEKLTLVSSEKVGFKAIKLQFPALDLIQGKKNFEISSDSSFFQHCDPFSRILNQFGQNLAIVLLVLRWKKFVLVFSFVSIWHFV